MGTNEPSGRGFAGKLRSALDAQDIGVRTLARRIDPSNVEGVRRRLNQYLSGERAPRPESRAEIARALGLDESTFDDEEDDPVRLLVNRIYREHIQDALIEAVRAAKAETAHEADGLPGEPGLGGYVASRVRLRLHPAAASRTQQVARRAARA